MWRGWRAATENMGRWYSWGVQNPDTIYTVGHENVVMLTGWSYIMTLSHCKLYHEKYKLIQTNNELCSQSNGLN